jgi:N-terminal acetyltransferase B complex catalytic subunit
VIGKAEGKGIEWHGHVTAITVAPEYRRLSLAKKMMSLLEHVSDKTYRGYFVDLYVRCTNTIAIDMYEGLGYSVYRRVREYYGSLGVGRSGQDEEDAFGLFRLHTLLLHNSLQICESRYLSIQCGAPSERMVEI